MTLGTMVRLLLIVPLLAAGIALGSPSPAAAATPGQNQRLTGVITDSVVVKANSLCVLAGATVRGGVTVEAGGILEVFNTEIRGSVSGSGVNEVLMWNGVVRGSVTVVGATQFAEFHGMEVRGDLTFSGGAVANLDVSIVRGSVTLNNNILAYATGNTIGANLTCLGNGPQSVYGSNTVGGATNCPAA